MVYDCISKIRNKHGIIVGYKLRSLKDGAETIVKAEQLKDSMHRQSVEISNLKLTTDGRIIDKKIVPDEFAKEFDGKNKTFETVNVRANSNEKIANAYTTSGSNPSQVNYAVNKINSKRVGKMVARALMLGIAATSLSGTLVGCGSNTVVTEAQAIESTQSISVDEKIAKLNSAKTIEVDVNNFTLNNYATVSVDGEKIGTIQGRFIAIFDTLKFETEDGQQIAVGDQGVHFKFDNWVVADKDNNVKYTMKEKFNWLTRKYVICDTNGNEVAYLNQNMSILDNSAKIFDMNDNVIAEIKQKPLVSFNDFTIEIKEDCEIDNVSVTTISVNYMMQKIYDDAQHHKQATQRRNRNRSR